jgi:hypothetical protein
MESQKDINNEDSVTFTNGGVISEHFHFPISTTPIPLIRQNRQYGHKSCVRLLIIPNHLEQLDFSQQHEAA